MCEVDVSVALALPCARPSSAATRRERWRSSGMSIMDAAWSVALTPHSAAWAGVSWSPWRVYRSISLSRVAVPGSSDMASLPRPHRDHTGAAVWGVYGVGDYGEMRVSAWLRGSVLSGPGNATVRAACRALVVGGSLSVWASQARISPPAGRALRVSCVLVGTVGGGPTHLAGRPCRWARLHRWGSSRRNGSRVGLGAAPPDT